MPEGCEVECVARRINAIAWVLPGKEYNVRQMFPWVGALALCAVLAGILDLGHFHTLQSGDSLMPVLVSLVHWTPFFWGQNYYGMLWPALVSPVHNPLVNFLIINYISIFMGIFAHFVVAYYFLRRRASIVVGIVSLAAFLGATRVAYIVDNLSPALFFNTPLVFAVAALLLLERPGAVRLGVGLAFMALATWVNVSTPLLMGILAATRDDFWTDIGSVISRRRWSSGVALRTTLALAATTIIGVALMRSQPYEGPEINLISWRLWGHALTSMATSFFGSVGSWHGVAPLPCLWLACIAVGFLLARLHPPYKEAIGPWWPWLARAVALMTLGAIFVAVQDWAQDNDFSTRYWYPHLLLAQVALISATCAPLSACKSTGSLRRAPAALASLLVVICLVRFGPVGTQTVRTDLARGAGKYQSAIDAVQPRFLAGNYWHVWPAVFYASLVSYESGHPVPAVWGLAKRADQGLECLPLQPDSNRRVLILEPDDHTAQWCQRMGANEIFLLTPSGPQRGAWFAHAAREPESGCAPTACGFSGRAKSRMVPGFCAHRRGRWSNSVARETGLEGAGYLERSCDEQRRPRSLAMVAIDRRLALGREALRSCCATLLGCPRPRLGYRCSTPARFAGLSTSHHRRVFE